MDKFVPFVESHGHYFGTNEPVDPHNAFMWNKNEWKVMLFFLFKTSQNELNPEDPHNPQARWVASNEVESLVTHPKDKSFFKSILSQI